jgi:hypothetical protein
LTSFKKRRLNVFSALPVGALILAARRSIKPSFRLLCQSSHWVQSLRQFVWKLKVSNTLWAYWNMVGKLVALFGGEYHSFTPHPLFFLWFNDM